MTGTLGRFPIDWQEARETSAFTKVTRDEALNLISGDKTPVLLSFRASSECVHMGEMIIPAGGVGPRQTEYDSHEGDAVFYMRQGTAVFLIEETEETFEVREREYMFIPEHTRYKCINYTGVVLTVIFIIAPKL